MSKVSVVEIFPETFVRFEVNKHRLLPAFAVNQKLDSWHVHSTFHVSDTAKYNALQVLASTLIKQYAHLDGLNRRQRASRSMFQNGANLLGCNTGKPLHELRNLCAVLKVFKQRGNSHARAAEHPGAADTLRVPLDGGAR